MKDYYENELLELNRAIDAEYTAIVEKRAKYCKEGKITWQDEGHDDTRLFSINTLYRLFPSHVRTLVKSSKQFSSATGFVEFKTFLAKQWGKKVRRSLLVLVSVH